MNDTSKKRLWASLVVLTALSLSACGGEKDGKKNQDQEEQRKAKNITIQYKEGEGEEGDDSKNVDAKDKDKDKDQKDDKKDKEEKNPEEKDDKTPEQEKEDPEESENTSDQKESEVYTQANLNFRREGNGEGQIIDVIPKGTKVTVIGSPKADFIKARYNGVLGYLSVDYLDNNPPSPEEETPSTQEEPEEPESHSEETPEVNIDVNQDPEVPDGGQTEDPNQSEDPDSQGSGDMVQNLEVKEEIAFDVQEIPDEAVAPGERVVKQEGRNGLKHVVYKVTYENGREIARSVVEETVLREPVPEIVHVGPKN